MNDLSKAHNLPDDFLRLFNFPQQQVVVGGTSSGVPIPPGMSLPPQQQYAPVGTPLMPHQVNVPDPVASQLQPPPQPVQQLHTVAPSASIPPPVSQPLPVTPQIPAQASNIGDAAGQAVLHQNATLRAQVEQFEAAQVTREAQAVHDEQARIQGLPKQDQIMAQLEILRNQNQMAISRAQEWQVEADRRALEVEARDLITQYDGELDRHSLDTSSSVALHASIPAAQEMYRVMESQMFSKFRNQMGLQNQAVVEGLPPSPGAEGYPSPNRAGAVVSLPAQAVSANPMAHPQVSRDNALNYTQTTPGRVFQPQGLPTPQPMANGQYFTPTYPQQGQYPPTLMQQPVAMQAPVVPNNPAAYQMAVQQQAAMQQGVGPQVMVAPTPDPNTRADGSSPGRNLEPYEQHGAVEAARASIAASRRAGMSGMASVGLREHPSVSASLNSYGPQTQQQIPIPTGQERARAHPQYMAGARV